MIPHKKVPNIPTPAPKEIPDTEGLVQQPHKYIDTRPELQKVPQYVKVPHYNDLYDSMFTKQGWRYFADGYAQGTVTTIAATTVLSVVNLTVPTGQAMNFRLQQWPGGTHVHLVVRTFSFGPSTATFTTQGEINALFIDQFGNTVPLAILPNNNFTTIGLQAILPTPITDVGDTALGNLSFTLNTGATVGNYAWQLGFSFAYMMPAKKGFTWEILHGYGLF